MSKLKPIDTAAGLEAYALKLLGRRDWGRQELVNRLNTRLTAPELLEPLLARLDGWGYLDDYRFVENFIRQRREYNGHGPVRIRQDLRQKGIPDDLLEQYLDGSEPVWTQACRDYRQRKFGAVPSDYTQKQKQMRHLQYKGFSFDQIQRAFDAHEDESD